MKSIFVLGLLFISFYDSAQKPSLDIKSTNDWTTPLPSPIIGPNGQFIAFKDSTDTFTTILSTSGNFRLKIPVNFSTSIIKFANDNRFVWIRTNTDSLIQIALLNRSNNLKGTQIKSFDISTKFGSGWVAYQGHDKLLRFFNPSSRHNVTIQNVENYYFQNGKDRAFVIVRNNIEKNVELLLVELSKMIIQKVWMGEDIKGITQDDNSAKIGFYENKKDSSILWTLDTHTFKLKRVIGCLNVIKSDNITLQEGEMKFTNKGSSLIFNFKKKKDTVKKNLLSPETVMIWDYRQNYFYNEVNNDETSLRQAVWIEKSNTILQLSRENEEPYPLSKINSDNQRYIIIWHFFGDWRERSWRSENRPSLYLISIEDGSRKLIFSNCYGFCDYPQVTLSPKNKFLIYFNRDKGHFFSYNINSGEHKNISSLIPYNLFDEEWDNPDKPYAYNFIEAGWLEDDSYILLYDRFDIWKVDPKGKLNPNNLTKEKGRKKSMALRLIKYNNSVPVIHENSNIILLGFNYADKTNGFLNLKIGNNWSLKQLTMGPYIYHLPQLSPSSFVSYPWNPIKASAANAWIVRRMSAKDYPNYFVTKDFVSYFQITHLDPEKKYNWYSTILISWRLPLGDSSKGILYIPENFDSTKKYPLLITFYERQSNRLNAYLSPKASQGNLEIPQYVSNGYIVFVPDLYFEKGKPGHSALVCINSSLERLLENKWIDSTHIGIQGHSFGGYIVNYLITQSKRFKAASSSAGASNLIDKYNALTINNNVGGQHYYENGQGRMGYNLWSNPSVYIKNSPIFYVDNIETPLLLLSQKEDEAVPFQQGVELFLSLRRLRKPTWLLQYAFGNHYVSGNSAVDYTIKQHAFFDHYLKEMRVPIWMTKQQADQTQVFHDNGAEYTKVCYLNCPICNSK